MPVTELALLHLHPSSTPLPDHVKPTLRAAMHAQSAWHAARFPDLPFSSTARAAAWFTQVEDPSYLLTVARWPDVGAHRAWIGSAENRGVMEVLTGGNGEEGEGGKEGEGDGAGGGDAKVKVKLGEQTSMVYDPVVKQWVPKAKQAAAAAASASESSRSGSAPVIVKEDTVLLHVAADIFDSVPPVSPPPAKSATGAAAGAETETTTTTTTIPLLQSPVISVSRLWITRENRAAWAAGFEDVKGVLSAYASPHLMRHGWRAEGDGQEEGEDEFVLVGGWESVERHFGFAQAPGFERYSALRPLIARADIKHYRPLSLD